MSIRKLGWPMSSRASPSTRPTGSTSCCLGTGGRTRRAARQRNRRGTAEGQRAEIAQPAVLTACLPFGGQQVQSFNLTDYTVGKALDGLFHYLGVEEAAIRSNPAARTTDLLKKVFG